MENMINLGEERSRRSWSRAVDELEVVYGANFDRANEAAAGLREAIEQDPLHAASQLGRFISKARAPIEERAWETVAGGPMPEAIGIVLNVFGSYYRLLTREEREAGLQEIMNFLNGQRYDRSQTFVEQIHDPWLLTDVVVSNGLYWPGFRHEGDIVAQDNSWEALQAEFQRAKSRYLLGLAVVYKSKGGLAARQAFANNSPDLFDRTLDGIATWTHSNGRRKPDEEQELLNKFPIELHGSINEKIQEAKWVCVG